MTIFRRRRWRCSSILNFFFIDIVLVISLKNIANHHQPCTCFLCLSVWWCHGWYFFYWGKIFHQINLHRDIIGSVSAKQLVHRFYLFWIILPRYPLPQVSILFDMQPAQSSLVRDLFFIIPKLSSTTKGHLFYFNFTPFLYGILFVVWNFYSDLVHTIPHYQVVYPRTMCL